MQLRDLIQAMELIAPTRYAEPWDNVGLLTGDPDQTISRVLLTIDYTPAVAAEAKRLKCNAVVAYHPPIFSGLKRIAADSVIHDAIRNGIAIYSPHTAWDAADGGANDALAHLLGLTELRPLKLAPNHATEYKLVVFAPKPQADAVAEAIFAAGAGGIGKYSKCSFRSPGTGTFFANEDADPAVGQRGRMEKVEEISIETLVSIRKLEAVIAAMRNAHPYEEPAFDLIQLAAVPDGKGFGRMGFPPPKTNRQSLIKQLKHSLHRNTLLIAGPTKGPVRKVAVCAGAGRDLLDHVMRENADVYITGELAHHDALRAANAGITVICTLHSNSERPSLRPLAHKIAEYLPRLKLHISKSDRDPFEIG